MTRNPITVTQSETPEHATILMNRHEIGALTVIHKGKLAGIITAKDLMMAEPRPMPEWDPRKKR
jgi:CBS domain-containing protein